MPGLRVAVFTSSDPFQSHCGRTSACGHLQCVYPHRRTTSAVNRSSSSSCTLEQKRRAWIWTQVERGDYRARPESYDERLKSDLNAPGLLNMLQSATVGTRARPYECAVLSGGSSMCSSLNARLKQEMKQLYISRVLGGDMSRLCLKITDPLVENTWSSSEKLCYGNVGVPQGIETYATAVYEGQSFCKGCNFFTYDDRQMSELNVTNTTTVEFSFWTLQRRHVDVSNGSHSDTHYSEYVSTHRQSSLVLNRTFSTNWPWSGENDVFEDVRYLLTPNRLFQPGCTIGNPENFAGELEVDLKRKSEARVTQGAGLSITVLRLLPCRSTLWRWDVYVTVGFERSTVSHDITQNTLNPDNWEEQATLLRNTCPPQAHFWNHQYEIQVVELERVAYAESQSRAGVCLGTCSDQVMDRVHFDDFRGFGLCFELIWAWSYTSDRFESFGSCVVSSWVVECLGISLIGGLIYVL
ncbi:hypothetical protein BDV93DRAFT_510834 [Ceratobasidium sp. AG-I]|nr:hypothetical protein BDV93DRAFT_510834 [Ceratobasidium sp. AG-I]